MKLKAHWVVFTAAALISTAQTHASCVGDLTVEGDGAASLSTNAARIFSDPRTYFVGPLENVEVLPEIPPIKLSSLFNAYQDGIYPYTLINSTTGIRELRWESPPERGVIFLDKLYYGSNLKAGVKLAKNGKYRVTFDTAFAQVIHACGTIPRKKFKTNPDGTKYEVPPNYWLTPDLQAAYTDLFNAGHAHSVEVWNAATGELVGGAYGVLVEGVYSSESLFHLEDNTSRIALYYLYEHLKAKGFKWIDTQMVSSETKALGGELIPRAEFMRMIDEAKKLNLKF